MILQDVNELADTRGRKVLLEEMEWRCPQKLATFQTLKSPPDKALWGLLDARAAFDEAATRMVRANHRAPWVTERAEPGEFSFLTPIRD